jgi:hypothetical protein
VEIDFPNRSPAICWICRLLRRHAPAQAANTAC